MFYGIYLAIRKATRYAVPVETLLMIWIGVVIIPFSVAESKVLRYILPVFPAFSLLCATSLITLLSRRHLLNFARAASMILAVAAVAIVAVPNYKIRGGGMRGIAPSPDAR